MCLKKIKELLLITHLKQRQFFVIQHSSKMQNAISSYFSHFRHSITWTFKYSTFIVASILSKSDQITFIVASIFQNADQITLQYDQMINFSKKFLSRGVCATRNYAFTLWTITLIIQQFNTHVAVNPVMEMSQERNLYISVWKTARCV